jgi:heptosyltransferase-2
MMNPEACLRMTVVRTGGLGDTILVLPALRLLRDRFPGVRLTLVGSRWAEAIRPLVPYPLEVVRFDASALTPLFGPSAERDPTGVFSESDRVYLYTASPGEDFATNVKRFCRGPVVVRGVEPAPGVHAADHFAAAVDDSESRIPDPGFKEGGMMRPPSIRDPGSELRNQTGFVAYEPLRVADPLRAWGREWLESNGIGEGPVAIHPGSGGRRKCWPAERFAEVAAGLGRPVVMLEGPADAEACRAFRDRVPSGLSVRMADGLSVTEAAALVSACDAFLGNDSGMSHLAAALGVPTVAVFGPTDPAIWAPRGPCVRIVRGAGREWPDVKSVRDAVAMVEGVAREDR